MGSFSTVDNYRQSAGNVSVDPRLLDILETAAALSGYNVQAFSGVAGRSAGTMNHPGGYAVDLRLEDATTGQSYSSYSGSAYAGDVDWQESFPVYEHFAQTARVVQQDKYPELDDDFRWGGYFNPGKGNSSPDLMHFDVNPAMNGAMGGGSWRAGATSAFSERWGITSNGGLATANGQRIVTALSQALSDGKLVPPKEIGAPTPMARPASLSTGPTAPTPFPRPVASDLQTLAPPNLPLNPELPTGAPQGYSNWPSTDQPNMRGRGLPSTGATGALGQQTSASAGAALGRAGTLTASGAAQPSNTVASGSASLSPAAAAPVPALRPIVAQVAPTPMPSRPADTAPTRSAATQDAPARVRLASGDMIEVGTYPSNDGMHSVQVEDDGTGNARVTRIQAPGEIPGVINPLREVNSNTVAGGVIRSMLPGAISDATDSATSSLANAARNIPNANAAVSAAQSLGNSLGSSTGALGNTLSSAFGTMGRMFALRNDNSSASGTAALQNIHDRNDDAAGSSLGSQSTNGAALGSVAAAAQPAIPTIQYRSAINPAWTAWNAQYGGTGTAVNPVAVNTLQDIHDQNDARIVAASAPRVAPIVPAAPARTIQLAVPSSGSGRSSSADRSSGGGSSAPATFRGTNTGRTYTVGATYANGNGTYVAQPDGTFQRV